MHLLNIQRFALLMVVLLAFGCSSKNKGKIEGTSWSSQASTVKGRSLPAGALQLDFGNNGKVEYRVGPQTYTGTYSLGWGDYVTLKFDQELAGRKSHSQKVVISGEQMTMTDSDGTQMTFSKVH